MDVYISSELILMNIEAKDWIGEVVEILTKHLYEKWIGIKKVYDAVEREKVFEVLPGLNFEEMGIAIPHRFHSC